MPTSNVVTFCSTGLAATERRALEDQISKIGEYCGDLTDRTKYLIADNVENVSEKIKVARRLGLPIVTPAFVTDSAAAGTLQPLDKYLLEPVRSAPKLMAQDSNVENVAPKHVAPQPAEKPSAEICSYIKDPLPILRGVTAFPEASATTIQLDGRDYSLDTPTGFFKHRSTPALAAAAANAADPPRAYTLRELLFAMKHASLSHADYFLQCALQQVEPVVMLDKRLLVSSTSGAEQPEADAAMRLLEPPLSRATLAAIDPRA